MSWFTGLRIGRAAGAAVSATIITTIAVGTAIGIRGAILASRSGGVPPGEEEMQALAAGTALIVGPIVGITTTVLAGWWAARGMHSRPVAEGLLVGLIIAVVGLIFTAFGPGLSAAHLIGRTLEVGAGALGGWIAGRRALTPRRTPA